MENYPTNRTESTEDKTVNTSDTNAFIEAALFQCWPGGPIVTKPSDCFEEGGHAARSSALPDLQITGNLGRGRQA